jgi:hypothetical protein
MMRTLQGQRQSAGLRTTMSPLNLKWKNKLRVGEMNPFPLAPIEFRKHKDAFTPTEYAEYLKKYNAENKKYGTLCNRFVQAELIDMERTYGIYAMRESRFNVMGAGLARDISWMKYANENLGMTGIIYDACSDAVKNAKRVLKRLKVLHRNVIDEIEVRGNSEISLKAKFTFASGFIQILPPDNMKAVMRMLGTALKEPQSRLMLIHATDRSNPNVLWGDTTPYSVEELLLPLEEGLGAIAKVHHRDNIPYWHHEYECLVFESGK